MITLSPEQEAALMDGVRKDLADRAWRLLEDSYSELAMVTIPRLAGMLELSTDQARRLAEPYMVEFGPRDTRISLADAKRLVDERRKKKRR